MNLTPPDELLLRGDLRAIRRMQERARLSASYKPEDMGAEFRRLFLGSDAGERVVMVILGWAGFWDQPMAFGQPDLTAYNLGRRQVGLQLWAALTEPLPGTDDLPRSGLRAHMDEGDDHDRSR